ncbi:hypothetical protein CSC62_05420 [Pseudoxanthomonas jiangsuensis]|uniref:Rz1-like lysis system protein LysC n=1 Tax=Pseudoxanthomonas jiangsuensis TaxID=619688 RepID=UPI001391BDA2|nr:hypothetical protein [Pseudoxanthomonas jiangsuensis]KAF1698349.1 hypothetical protein CSC62_05420 [Pseudoxanthomonas jiangsuensis]
MRALILTAALLALAGCQTCPDRPQVPEVVKVPVRVTVPVPPALTDPCPVARAASRTVESVVQAYNANVESLETCNRKLGEIRALPTTGGAP